MLNMDISQSGGRVHVRPEPNSINTATHLLTGSLTSPSKPCRQVYHSVTSSVDRIRLQALQAFSSFLRHPNPTSLCCRFQLVSGTFLRAVAQNIPLCRNLRRHLAQIVQDRRRRHNDNAQMYSSSSAQTVTSTKEEEATDART